MHSRDIQPELLCHYKSHGPYACFLCGRGPTSPHHVHRQGDPYWQQINVSPHHCWNLRSLCVCCHSEVKNLLGEFSYSLAPAKRASRIARVKEFLATFKQERARELIPGWVLEELMYDVTPENPYGSEIERIGREAASEG